MERMGDEEQERSEGGCEEGGGEAKEYLIAIA